MPTGNTSINVQSLMSSINKASDKVQEQLDLLQQKSDAGESVSVGDMFNTQFLMNQLSQISETSTSTMSALNSALASMARNVKG